MKNSFPKSDGSYALGSPIEREKRLALLDSLHSAPLRDYVLKLRDKTGFGEGIPFFDPLDGGTRAKVLVLLEAPGPKAVASGFISCDNPDPTARNFRNYCLNADLRREEMALWNIVPWYIGDDERSKIRAATGTDTQEGFGALRELRPLFPELRAVLLLGLKAQSQGKAIRELCRVPIFSTFHLSALSLKQPGKPAQIEADFKELARFLAT